MMEMRLTLDLFVAGLISFLVNVGRVRLAAIVLWEASRTVRQDESLGRNRGLPPSIKSVRPVGRVLLML